MLCIVTENLGDELTICGGHRQRVHHLNKTAAHPRRRCEGKTSLREIDEKLCKCRKEAIDERIMHEATNRFQEEALLADCPTKRMVSRRCVLKAAGVGSPLVMSITAPTSADAKSGESSLDEQIIEDARVKLNR